MKVQLVASEYFSWGVYGGFGAFTRKLAKELMDRGVEVEVIVQKISNEQKPQGETELIDDVPVKTLPRRKISKLRNKSIYKTDADIIHSQCGMFDTYLSFIRNQEPKKIVTVQDLRNKIETKALQEYEKTSGYPWYKKLWGRYVYRCFQSATEQADIIGYQAQLLKPKIQKIYKPRNDVPLVYLPNFIDIPKGNFNKTDKPSVLWLGRLDPVKRPELCFKLAVKMRDVDFYILGKAHDETRDKLFRSQWQNISNLHFLGFQSGQVKEEILSKAWILINTSYYECLPVSFLEALAHKCALLSTRNPDDYTNQFGVHVKANVKALAWGLSLLLTNDSWRGLGQKGYNHVKHVHSTEKGVGNHIKLYRELVQ